MKPSYTMRVYKQNKKTPPDLLFKIFEYPLKAEDNFQLFKCLFSFYMNQVKYMPVTCKYPTMRDHKILIKLNTNYKS